MAKFSCRCNISDCFKYHSRFSLPRPSRSQSKQKSDTRGRNSTAQRNIRSRSLEYILDSNSSSSQNSSSQNPNYWVQEGTGLRTKTPIQKPPRKSLLKQNEAIRSVEPVRRSKVPLPPKYYHTMATRHPVIRRVNSIDSFTSLSELSFPLGHQQSSRKVVGSLHNLAQPSPRWQKKPERFYDAYNVTDGSMPQLPPKKIIHRKSLPSATTRTSSRIETEPNMQNTNSDFANLPPPPGDFYDSDPRSMHVTIAYLNATQSSIEDDHEPINDPYQTLRSNHSVKSVKIAPEVTEFHYSTQGL